MEAEKSTYIINENNELGEVIINDDVLALIAAMAAMEVDGVTGMAGNITAEIVAKLGMKKLAKGVRVEVVGDKVSVDLAIVLDMNKKVIEISKKVQDKVKATIENMTNMEVVNVNINITTVSSK